MTRINSNIHPEELHTVHLLAEHREILRVIDVAKKAHDRGYIPQGYGIPETFCLGNGHVKFFSNKLEFIVRRYEIIFNECMNRNLKVTKFIPCVKTLCDLWEWYNNWESTEQEDDLVRERILERVAANRKKYNFPDDAELNQETWSAHVKKDREQRIRGKM